MVIVVSLVVVTVSVDKQRTPALQGFGVSGVRCTLVARLDTPPALLGEGGTQTAAHGGIVSAHHGGV
jgi:hypothetical protein